MMEGRLQHLALAFPSFAPKPDDAHAGGAAAHFAHVGFPLEMNALDLRRVAMTMSSFFETNETGNELVASIQRDSDKARSADILEIRKQKSFCQCHFWSP